jgi:predicted dehydrogenase
LRRVLLSIGHADSFRSDRRKDRPSLGHRHASGTAVSADCRGPTSFARRVSGPSPFQLVPNRPSSPYAALLPVPHDGVAVGYAEAFGFMIKDFLAAIADGTPMTNGSILDGLRAAQALDAIQESAATNGPVSVSRAG